MYWKGTSNSDCLPLAASQCQGVTASFAWSTVAPDGFGDVTQQQSNLI